jgi:hypothetical protein
MSCTLPEPRYLRWRARKRRQEYLNRALDLLAAERDLLNRRATARALDLIEVDRELARVRDAMRAHEAAG